MDVLAHLAAKSRPNATYPDIIGLTGLYLFAFGAWLNKGIVIVGLALVLLACLLEASTIWKQTKRLPLVWIVLATATYILFRTLVAAKLDPAHAALHLKDGARLSYLCGFLLIGWRLFANQERILTLLAVAGCGFLLARLWHFDWSDAATSSWWKTRTGLGLPEIAFGYYAATLLLGLIIFAPRMFRRVHSPVAWAVGLIAWLLLVLLSMEGVVLSQSRAVWASIFLVSIPLLIASRRFPQSIPKTWRFLLAGSALLGITAIIHFNWDTLALRISQEPGTYEQLLSGRYQDITTSYDNGNGKSVGIRLKMLGFGFTEWQRAPFFGQGPAAAKILLHDSDIPFFSPLNDLHNGIVDSLVRLGIVGLLLLGLCLAATLLSGWRAYRTKRMSPDLFLFLTSSTGLLLLSMLTNFRMLNGDWRYWLFLISGAMASYGLHQTTGHNEHAKI